MSRRVFLVGVAILLVAAAFLATDAALWRPGPTEANVRRIRAGMTLRQVRAILGRPGKGQFFGSGPQTLLWWEGPAGVAFVSFRTHERAEPAEGAGVIPAAFFPSNEPGIFDRARSWLGW